MFWKKSSFILLYILTILIIVILLYRDKQHQTVSRQNSSADLRKNAVVSAIEKTMPSVVNISTMRIIRSIANDPLQRLFDQFLRSQEDSKSYSLGSGFIVDSTGLIVTNAHVVDRATRIVITLNNGKNYDAFVVADDSLNDIALLKLTNPPAGLQAVLCDQSNRLFLGETVIAVGNPFGLGSSISVGALSGERRRLTLDNKVLFSDILQTDAIVYPGNSGGPLINVAGEVIGMNMSVYENAPGIGFAIPFSRVENILAKWLLPERFCGCILGIVPGWGPGNTLIAADILHDSPAMKAGIRKGDVIRRFNGKRYENLLTLSQALIRIRKDKAISVETQSKVYHLTPAAEFRSDVFQMARQKLSLDLAANNEMLAHELNLPVSSGLLVAGRMPDTPEHIRRGDLLIKLGMFNINSASDLRDALRVLHYNDTVPALFLTKVILHGEEYLVRRMETFQVR